MDLKDQLKQIGERFVKLKEQIQTEEATKNAFVMPFLQSLGYDVFNPLEVVPENITDIGTKKGEKIDYAIFRDNKPTILIECKHWNKNLDLHDEQLLRYFHVSKAKFGILTNGIVFRFYSDLVQPNIMDEKPFFEINLTDLKDSHIEEIKKFHKANFDADSIITNASELKYMNELKQLFQAEVNNPSAELVKYFTKQVYPNMITVRILEQFTSLTKRAMQHHISDLITERLKSALTKENEAEKQIAAEELVESAENANKIVTTEEELEAFLIIKTILRQNVAVNRIHYRDNQSYFAILLDDNNRKPLCRLYFNSSKKYVGIFDEQKKETKVELQTLDSLFELADTLKKATLVYENI